MVCIVMILARLDISWTMCVLKFYVTGSGREIQSQTKRRKETKAQFAKGKNIKKQVLKTEMLRTIRRKRLGRNVQQDVSMPLYNIIVPKDMRESQNLSCSVTVKTRSN